MASLANVNRLLAAGFRRLDFHQLDTNGLPAGVSGTVSAGRAGAPAGRIYAVKTANIATPASTNVPVEGDDILQATFQFSNNAARAFDIAASEDNFANRQAFQGILTRQIGNVNLAGRDIFPFTLNNVLLIAVSNAKAQTPGIRGLGMYAGVIAPQCQIAVRGRSTYAGRTAAQFDASVTMALADRYPWGETYQANNEGFTGSYAEDWSAAYPMTIHRHKGDGTTTVFDLQEKPSSTSLLDVLVYLLDTNQIPTRQVANVTIAQTYSGQLTFTTPPTASQDIVTFYQYIPTANG